MAVCNPIYVVSVIDRLIQDINNRHDYLLQTGDMREASII